MWSEESVGCEAGSDSSARLAVVASASPALAPLQAPVREFLPRLDSLTGLRFFAAYFVLQHHFTNFGMIPFLDRYTGFGTTGVTFFFVLSGFVLTWSFVPSDTAPRFYWRRFARIWPLHAVTTLIALPVFYGLRGQPFDFGAVTLSFLLLHAWVPTATTYFAGNPASWTLSCEAFFYAIHPFIVRRVLAMRAAGLGTAAAVVAGALYVGADQSGHLSARLGGWFRDVSPIFKVLEFLLGVVLAAALRRGYRLRIRLVPAVVMLGAWFVVYYNLNPHFSSQLRLFVAYLNFAALPVLYALIIAAAAQLDLNGAPSLLRSRLLVTLGQWSYALYLIQASIIYALVEWLGPRQTSITNVGWLVVVSALCIGASGILYTVIEHPTERRLRAMLRR